MSRTDEGVDTMSAAELMEEPPTELDQVKAAQQSAWAAGNFAVVARHTVFPGELLVEAVDLRAGQRVLDVATGSGNVAISAARRGVDVIGVDYVAELLEAGRRRAAAEQLDIEFEEADCEALPFEDGSFDVVLSLYGAMFAPDQQRAADEILRVTRPGGRIGLGSWTPEGFWGHVFKVQSKFAPRPAGSTPPTAWGTEGRLRDLFSEHASFDAITRRHTDFRFASVDAWFDFFRTYFGPMVKLLDRLDAAQQVAFADDLKQLATRFNRADGGSLVIPGEYLEVVLTKL